MTTPEALPAAKDLPCETQTTIRQGSAPPPQPRINLHSGYFPIGEERFCALECAAAALADTTLAGTILLARVCLRVRLQSLASWPRAPGAGGASHIPRSARKSLTKCGRFVTIPSTPSSMRDRISSGSSTVHTCTARPAVCAAATKRRSTTLSGP